MSIYEFAVIFVTAAFALVKLFLQILQKTEKPFTRQHFWDGLKKIDSLESIVGTIMLGIIMGVALKLVTTTLPRLEATAERTEQTTRVSEHTVDYNIKPRLEHLERALDAFLSLTETDHLQDTLNQIAQALRAVNGINDSSIRLLFKQHFDWATTNFTHELVSIRSNKVNIQKEAVLRFSELVISNAQSSIDATSYVDPAKWWTSADGDLYLTKNAEAIQQRQVRIRRIFVYKTDEERETVERLALNQKRLGVDVYIADINKLPTALRKDIIIMDNKLAGTLAISPDRDFTTALVTRNPQDIKETIGEWNDLLRVSRRL
jgi:hypothetical protein